MLNLFLDTFLCWCFLKVTFQRMPVFQTGLDAAKLTSGPACISSQQHVPSKGVFSHIYLLVWVKRSLGIFTTISQVW